MSSFRRLYPVTEMARPVGSLAKTMRAALEIVRQSGEEFTAKRFCEILASVGVENPHPASVGIRLAKMSAPEGERADALHPLIRPVPGRRGQGGTGTFKYVFDGPAGSVRKSSTGADDEPEAGGGEETGQEPELEPDDGEEPEAPRGPAPGWIPRSNPMGDYAEVSMEKLEDAGIRREDPMWIEIAKTNNDLEAHRVIAKHVPVQLRRAAIRVAQEIFRNLQKQWEEDPAEPGTEPTLPDDAPGAASQRPSASKAAPSVMVRKRAPEPVPEPEPEELGDDDIEPAEDEPWATGLKMPKQFFNSPEPEAPPSPAPELPKKKKSPLSKFFKR
jgi:hypothetical protein